MLGKLTQQTLGMMPSLGALTEDTLARVRALGSSPEVSYQGYRIRPTPKQLQTGAWTLEGFIVRDNGGTVREQAFGTGDTFSTCDEAVAWAIKFGQAVIDGRVQGLSVAGL